MDEVYLEAMYDQRPQPAIHLGEQFVVTSSLTKAFGLSGLRCGWILANPELTRRMWHINDLYGVNAAIPADLLSVIALDNLDRVSMRAKKLLEANRPALDASWNRGATSMFPTGVRNHRIPQAASRKCRSAGSVVAREIPDSDCSWQLLRHVPALPHRNRRRTGDDPSGAGAVGRRA